MYSDGYRFEPIFEGAVIEVLTSVGSFGGEQVSNLVYHHKLKEVKKDKKEFMGMIKAYLKRIVGLLTEKGHEHKIKKF